LANDFPIAAIAAIFEASNYLSKMGLPTIFADETMLDIDNEMDMFWHDNIVLYLNDWIVGIDAVEQFVLHHFSDGCEFHFGRIRMAIREFCVANDSA
jgi:hypothetical protein